MSNNWLTRLYMVLIFMAAMVLESLELGWGNYGWLSPSWVFILVIFWTIYYPSVFGIGTAWAAGLLMDVWTAELLGKHALFFLLASFIITVSYSNFSKSSFMDRVWVVAMMILVYQLALVLVTWNFSYFLSIEILKLFGTVLSSTLLWFCVSWVADRNIKPERL